MKKYIKLISLIIGLAMLGGIVYAASSRKSPKLPWQGTPSEFYDTAHNVGDSNAPQARFSFVEGTGTGVVKDSVTGLMWQSEGSNQYGTTKESGALMTWTDAKSYCAGLELGGYKDWRLPNIKELSSIVDYSRRNPSVDTTYFNFASVGYWSSTTDANSISSAWVVSFASGDAAGSSNTSNNYVVCTR